MRASGIRQLRVRAAVLAVMAVATGMLVPIAGDATPALAAPVAPSSIGLSTDKATILAGQNARLTATTDVSVSGTGQTLRIVDQTTNTEVKSCTSGSTCRVNVQFVTGDAHTYVATVGSLESNPVEVARAAWTIDLAADSDTLSAGQTTRLQSTANQNVGNTAGEYETYIFNLTTGELLTSCTSGKICSVRSEPFYDDDASTHMFLAMVGAVGDPSGPEDVEDVQASSGVVTITRASWSMDISADRSEVSAGDVVNVTATTNQNVGLTNGKYSMYIFEAASGALLSTCTTGTTCSASVTWDGAGYGLTFVAFVATTGTPSNIGDVIDVQTSNGVSVMIDPWDVALTADRGVLAAGEKVALSASTDQNLSETGGQLTLYIVEWVNGTIVKSCTGGTTCNASDQFYKPTDQPYAGHSYAAIVADSGATDPDDITGYRAYAGGLDVAILPWIIEMDWTGKAGSNYQFTSVTNQDPSKTSGQLSIYLFSADDDTYQATCNVGTRCLLTAQSFSGSGFYAFVAERLPSPPATSYDVGDSVRAAVSVSGAFLGDVAPVFGPLLFGESQSGTNPSEKPCQCSHADPVNTATGEYYENAADIVLPGTGPGLSISRSYSTAAAAADGPFGFGWSPIFDAQLDILIPGNDSNPMPRQVQVTQENGSTVLFTRAGSSSYRALDRVNGELSYAAGSGTWLYTRDLTTFMTFDGSGALVSAADRYGNAITFGRDGSGHVTTMSASGGRQLTLTWSGAHVTAVSDSANRSVSYGYDSAGNLVSVTAVDGAVTTYGYDGGHYITTVTQPGGGVTTNAYDESHRVVSQTDPIGRVTSFGYDDVPSFPDNNISTTITAPDGSETVEVYAQGALVSQTRAAGTAYEATTLYQYDSALNLISTTDPAGATTTYTYNSDGRMLTHTDALGRTTTWTYNARGDVKTVTDPLGRVTRYSYDENGNLTTIRSPGDHVQRFTYNPDGTIATQQDPRGKVTSYAYTAAGWLQTVVDPTGRVTSTGYGPAGFPTSTTDSAGETTTFVVDEVGRLLSSTDPLERTTVFGYDADGNATSATDPSGATTTATFDLARQQTSTTDATGNTTAYTYTPLGSIATTIKPGDIVTTNAYNLLGQLVSTTDPLARVTTYGYDDAGNLTTTTNPSGAEAENRYDLAGQKIASIDPDEDTTAYTYDAAGQLVSTVDPLDRETTVAYTADGLIDTITLADGSTEHYVYDNAGNVTAFTNADGETTSYAYDAAGRPLTQTRPGGLITRHNYDPAGRVFVTKFPDLTTLRHFYDAAGQLIRIDPSVAGEPDITYTYDAAGRRIEMTDATGISGYTYDAAGRLTGQTDGSADTIGYDYDTLGRLTGLTYPGNETVTYAYDAAGQMTALTDWNDRTIAFTWTLDGQLDARVDPNGITYNLGYTAAGQTSTIAAGTSSDNLLGIAYDYDAAGQLVGRDITGTSIPDDNTEYNYDPLGQLAATMPGGDYESTPGGQLVHHANGATLAYNTAQQLASLTPTSGPATTFTYNGNGARLSATTGSATLNYRYTPFGDLASVDTGITTVNYKVDGDGVRQSRTVGSATDEFTWSTGGDLALLLDDDEHRYLYGPGIAPLAQIDSDDDIEYLYGDNVGSTFLLADEDATTYGSYAYNEYGVTTGHTGALTTLMQYTAAWTDPDTGLIHLRARDYDPNVGQFLQVDPALANTRQAYAYVGNNPLAASDPTGLCVGLDGTPQDRACTYNDYYWDGLPGAIYARACGTSDWWTCLNKTFNPVYKLIDGIDKCSRSSDPYACAVMTFDPVYQVLDGLSRLPQDIESGCGWAAAADVAQAVGGAAGTLGVGLGGVGIVRSPGLTTANTTISGGTRVLTSSEQRAVTSLQAQVDSHVAKLQEYRADPWAYDNQGLLANAKTAEIQQAIINGRIQHLETEIRGFQNQIDAILGAG